MTLRNELDRETVDSYELHVLAIDKGELKAGIHVCWSFL